jgi:hypothetical protein
MNRKGHAELCPGQEVDPLGQTLPEQGCTLGLEEDGRVLKRVGERVGGADCQHSSHGFAQAKEVGWRSTLPTLASRL